MDTERARRSILKTLFMKQIVKNIGKTTYKEFKITLVDKLPNQYNDCIKIKKKINER